MFFDWITWSIWLIGFTILIIWIIVPVREFKRMIQRKRAQEKIKRNKDNELVSEKKVDNN